jgi:hypothetical protein
METLKIAQALRTNNRLVMVRTIKEFSEEEYESPDSIWDLAMQTKKELRNTLYHIYEYYSKNEEQQ